jgi:superfamily II DNA or RNA helicase
MLADEPTLRPGLYSLPEAPLGPQVLIPGFRSATSVRGAFGWFTSGWIARLAPGLASYLNRADVAPIRFTVSPHLWPAEREAAEVAQEIPPAVAAQRIAEVFLHGRAVASALGRHALDCLAWMLAADRLRLKVAVPIPGFNYHPKVWLFEDGAHQVLVRGSANATGRGLGAAVEHMDVDVTWAAESRDRVAAGIAMLDSWSEGRSPGISRVLDLPEALRSDIIETAPEQSPSPDDYLRATQEDSSSTSAQDPLESLRARFATDRTTRPTPRLLIPDWLEWQTGDYSHQGEAVAAWESTSEPERGTIAMATGAGKTYTALICAARLQERIDNAALLVVISAPSVPLILQWQRVVREFGVDAVTPTVARDTDRALTNLSRSLRAGGTHVAVVTNNLLCTDAFQTTLASVTDSSARRIATLLIGDEAHTLGAKGFLANQPEFLERRLALSATPERQYDPDGTEAVFEFFGPPVYEFGLDRAIGFCLAPYDYYVHATTLDSDELDEFESLTEQIRRVAFLTDTESAEDDTALKRLLIKRRRIIETARAKLPLLKEVLRRREPGLLRHTLVYASAKNPAQFTSIGNMLGDLGMSWAPVTEQTSSSTLRLNDTMTTFADGGYQALLAKKVLDEGVDIPSVREAFLVASSTVEREWIQRRGRVLRMHPNKPWAIIHDFLALPPVGLLRAPASADRDLRRIVQGELSRALAFAAHARNAGGTDGALSHLEMIRNAYWPDSNGEFVLQNPGDHLIAPGTPKGAPW